MRRKNYVKIISRKITKAAEDILKEKLIAVIPYVYCVRGDFLDEADIDYLVVADISAEERNDYNNLLCKATTDLGLENDMFIAAHIVLKDNAKFEALSPLLVSNLIYEIGIEDDIPYFYSLVKLYSSELYANLENKETKYWHKNTEILYSMLKQGEQAGTIELPNISDIGIRMNRYEMDFVVFCMEIFKQYRNMTGKKILALFLEYGVIDYIVDGFEVLHTTGERYLCSDIDEFLRIREE